MRINVQPTGVPRKSDSIGRAFHQARAGAVDTSTDIDRVSVLWIYRHCDIVGTLRAAEAGSASKDSPRRCSRGRTRPGNSTID